MVTMAQPRRDAALPDRIPPEEFRARQDRARAAARDRGLGGLIAWSRGGSTQDRYAEVQYLANFYTHFPFIPDAGERWSARGHTALVLPVEGPATLVIDVAVYRDDLAVADDVVVAQDVVGATLMAAREALPEGLIGVLGADTLAWPWHTRLAEGLGSRLVDAGDLGPQLRVVKSPAEIDLLRAAGLLGTDAVEAILEAAVPGATDAEAAAAGVQVLMASGGMLFGISISAGPYAAAYSQSQPAPFDPRYRLQPRDMFRVDLYGSVDGYLFDFGRSRVVGGAGSAEQQALLAAARDPIVAGLEEMRPGRTLGDVARRCDEVLEASEWTRLGLGLEPAFGSWGHSLGLAWEPPWIDASSDVEIVPGMALALEKRIAAPGIGGATYEDDVIVTRDGCEVVTPARHQYA